MNQFGSDFYVNHPCCAFSELENHLSSFIFGIIFYDTIMLAVKSVSHLIRNPFADFAATSPDDDFVRISIEYTQIRCQEFSDGKDSI